MYKIYRFMRCAPVLHFYARIADYMETHPTYVYVHAGHNVTRKILNEVGIRDQSIGADRWMRERWRWRRPL